MMNGKTDAFMLLEIGPLDVSDKALKQNVPKTLKHLLFFWTFWNQNNCWVQTKAYTRKFLNAVRDSILSPIQTKNLSSFLKHNHDELFTSDILPPSFSRPVECLHPKVNCPFILRGSGWCGDPIKSWGWLNSMFI